MFIGTKMRPEGGSSLLPLFGKKIITGPNSNPISTGIGNTYPGKVVILFLCKNTFAFLKLKTTSLSVLRNLGHIGQLQCSLGWQLFMKEKAPTTFYYR